METIFVSGVEAVWYWIMDGRVYETQDVAGNQFNDFKTHSKKCKIINYNKLFKKNLLNNEYFVFQVVNCSFLWINIKFGWRTPCISYINGAIRG